MNILIVPGALMFYMEGSERGLDIILNYRDMDPARIKVAARGEGISGRVPQELGEMLFHEIMTLPEVAPEEIEFRRIALSLRITA